MSLINGPEKPTPVMPTPDKSLSAQIPRPLALRAIREMEKMTGVSLDPAPTYLFSVEVAGLIVALFTRCSGIGASRSVETVQEGGLNDTFHQLPGPITYNNLVLSRGLSVSRVLWDWFLAGMYDFKVKRINISVVQGAAGMNLAGMVSSLFGSGYGVVKRWNIEKAFPVSWRISDLNVDDTSSVVIETLEIAHEGISLSMIAGTPLF
jgi:phage tail-like protein